MNTNHKTRIALACMIALFEWSCDDQLETQEQNLRSNASPAAETETVSVDSVASIDSENLTFEGSVLPILKQSCLGCHGESSSTLRLHVFEDKRDFRLASARWQAVIDSIAEGRMPLGALDPVPPTNLAILKRWYQQTFEVLSPAPTEVVLTKGGDDIFASKVLPIMTRSCMNCHSGGRNGIRVEVVDDASDTRSSKQRWDSILRRIESKTMPPAPFSALIDAEIETVRQWVLSEFHATDTVPDDEGKTRTVPNQFVCNEQSSAGPAQSKLRKLSRNELLNTYEAVLPASILSSIQPVLETIPGPDGHHRSSEQTIFSKAGFDALMEIGFSIAETLTDKKEALVEFAGHSCIIGGQTPETLLGHYSFNAKTPEVTRGSWADGTLINGVGFQDNMQNDGIFSRAASFDGVNDFVDLGPRDLSGDKLTVSAWVNPDAFTTADAQIITMQTGNAAQDRIFMISTVLESGFYKVQVSLKVSGVTTTTTTLRSIAKIYAGAWTHVAFTYDGKKLMIYINGVLNRSVNLPGQIAATNGVAVTIGGSTMGKHFDGMIDEVVVSKSTMNADEVLALKETGVIPGTQPEVPEVPEINDVDSCLRFVISNRGPDLLRRPLGSADVDRLHAMTQHASFLTFNDRKKALIAGLFQQPEFLLLFPYQDATTDDIDSVEVANFISYTTTGLPPDATLRMAVQTNALSTKQELELQVRRLVDSSHGNLQARRFFGDWLSTDNAADPVDRPGFIDGFNTAGLRSEADVQGKDFFQHVLTTGGTFSDLMTQTAIPVPSDRIADLYGAVANSEGFIESGDRRAGLLGLPIFNMNGGTTSSLITRGVRIRRDIICDTLPSPNFADLLGRADGRGEPDRVTNSNREFWHKFTLSDQACSSCHVKINALAYPLEAIDSIGRSRQLEKVFSDITGEFVASHAIDLVAVPEVIAGDTSEVRTIRDLGSMIATSGKGGACFVRKFFEFNNYRSITSSDRCNLSRAEELLRNGESLKDAMVAAIVDQIFGSRHESLGE